MSRTAWERQSLKLRAFLKGSCAPGAWSEGTGSLNEGCSSRGGGERMEAGD